MSASVATAHQLFQENQPLVRGLAWQIHRQLPARFDIDDLIAYGQLGLAEAARDYDPERAGKFSTFAYYRIRGAILDGLGKLSGVSRALCRRIRQERGADEAINAVEGATPNDQSVADSAAWFRQLAGSLAVSSLIANSTDEEIGVENADFEPTRIMMRREAAEILNELIGALPEEASRLIRATYFEGCTLQEAGSRIGISKAWASRLHAKALQQLAFGLRQHGIDQPSADE